MCEKKNHNKWLVPTYFVLCDFEKITGENSLDDKKRIILLSKLKRSRAKGNQLFSMAMLSIFTKVSLIYDI